MDRIAGEKPGVKKNFLKSLKATQPNCNNLIEYGTY
jgi:hypothetical protein